MDSILQTITRALREHDMAPTTFGRLAVGDPRFVQDLQRGRELRRSTEASVIAFLNSMSEMPSWQRQNLRGIARDRRAAEGTTAEQVCHRISMRAGSKALLAAIRTARGEA